MQKKQCEILKGPFKGGGLTLQDDVSERAVREEAKLGDLDDLTLSYTKGWLVAG